MNVIPERLRTGTITDTNHAAITASMVNFNTIVDTISQATFEGINRVRVNHR